MKRLFLVLFVVAGLVACGDGTNTNDMGTDTTGLNGDTGMDTTYRDTLSDTSRMNRDGM